MNAQMLSSMLRTLAALLLLLAPCARLHAQAVVCFGDSLTAGHGAPPGSAYPDFLRKDLVQAGYRVTVINQGIDGNTTADGQARLPSVLAAHPSLVVLELGSNDALLGQPLPGLERNLDSLIEALQQAHIPVLLAGIDIPDNLGFTPPAQLTTPYMKQYYALYPAVAARYHLPLIPFLLQGVYGVAPLMSPDYIHPNGAGYEKVAQTVLPYVEKMLTR